VLLRIVSAISIHNSWTLARNFRLALCCWNLSKQTIQVRHVVMMGTCGMSRKMPTVTVGQGMELRAGFAAVCGVWAGLFPKKTARILEESTIARDQLSLSASCSRSRRTRWNLSETPAAVESRRRLQQVMPEPHPSSWRKCSQPMPVLSTSTLPVQALEGSIGLRLWYRWR
jgi:hypothetical protein